MKGLIFSIEEFAIHDGDGLRTGIFFKGCPLRCQWCHNPEGLKCEPQIVHNPNGCLNCGRCREVCLHKGEDCVACGHCAAYCPRGLIRITGQWWEAKDLAQHVKQLFPFPAQGGVTLSGGEVLMQPAFAVELLEGLKPMHRAIETSGQGSSTWFEKILKQLEFVYMDVKHMDSALHKKYTGFGNEQIQNNLSLLMASGLPYTVRVPTIVHVNDDDANFTALAKRLQGSKTLKSVELLPYNAMAGAKYAMVGMQYPYKFETPSQEKLEHLVSLLNQYDIPATFRKAV